MGVSRDSFHWSDYLIFCLMLAASLGIGIYHSCAGGKQRTQGEYFLGDRNMATIPVSFSLLMSFMSPITVLGAAAEMFMRGTQWFFMPVGFCFSTVLAALICVPLLHPLKLTSANEYLQARFRSKAVKYYGTFLLIISQSLYVGAMVYLPATSLEAATGIPYWASLLTSSAVATLYTSLGGMKAVVWTDCFQAIVMISGLIGLAVAGAIEVGGISEVWRINEKWDRIEMFNFDPDPTVQHTFWTCIFGGMIGFWSMYGVNQAAVQRYSSIPTVRQAQVALLLNIPGLILVNVVVCVTGIVVFAYFANMGCDPIKDGQISNPNQLAPYFIMKVLAYPCVPGLFVAILFAGSLSTMSSCLNGLAAVTWVDLLSERFSGISESRKTLISKLIGYGAIGTGFGFALNSLSGSVVQMASSFILVSMAPILGLFLLGGLFPWVNWIGALVGGVFGLVVPMWISVGKYYSGLGGFSLPTPHENCTNYTPHEMPEMHLQGLEHLYSVSYLYFTSIGLLTTIIIGLTVSFLSGPNKSGDIERKYLIPYFDRMWCCLPERIRKPCRCGREDEGTIEELSSWMENDSSVKTRKTNC